MIENLKAIVILGMPVPNYSLSYYYYMIYTMAAYGKKYVHSIPVFIIDVTFEPKIQRSRFQHWYLSWDLQTIQKMETQRKCVIMFHAYNKLQLCR
jgi:hypothetical protein